MMHQRFAPRIGRTERAIPAIALFSVAVVALFCVPLLGGTAEQSKEDMKELEQLNVKVGEAEADGDGKWLGGLLAEKFTFMRASGAVVDRDEFLKAVKKSGKRETRVDSITLHGEKRAVVTCVVTLEGKKYHNLRTFVRPKGEWKLFSWANEELPR